MIKKITYGFVVQEFDDYGFFLSQEFVAGDQVEFEDGQGEVGRNHLFGRKLGFVYYDSTCAFQYR